jgi:hypothetical protein
MARNPHPKRNLSSETPNLKAMTRQIRRKSGKNRFCGDFSLRIGLPRAITFLSQDKAVRLRCHRVNGFFLEDDQSDRFFFYFFWGFFPRFIRVCPIGSISLPWLFLERVGSGQVSQFRLNLDDA